MWLFAFCQMQFRLFVDVQSLAVQRDTEAEYIDIDAIPSSIVLVINGVKDGAITKGWPRGKCATAYASWWIPRVAAQDERAPEPNRGALGGNTIR